MLEAYELLIFIDGLFLGEQKIQVPDCFQWTKASAGVDFPPGGIPAGS